MGDVKTVTGPVIEAIYNVSTVEAIDESLRNMRARGRSWDPDRDVLLDARSELARSE